MLFQNNKLSFRNHLNLGVEGCNLLKGLLRKRPVMHFTAWDCALTQSQFTLLVEGLLHMSNTEVTGCV